MPEATGCVPGWHLGGGHVEAPGSAHAATAVCHLRSAGQPTDAGVTGAEVGTGKGQGRVRDAGGWGTRFQGFRVLGGRGGDEVSGF